MSDADSREYINALLDRVEEAGPKLLLLLKALGLDFDEGVALVGMCAGELLSTAASLGCRDDKAALLDAFVQYGETRMDQANAAIAAEERQGSVVN
jgi:hypothetical protein